MKRKATAVWNGSGKEGTGSLTSPSGVLSNTPYSFATRFEDEPGTNPEELLAAAHAGCFSMKLSFVLGNSGITPESIETTCTIGLEDGTIATSHLDVTVKADGLSEEDMLAAVTDAEQNCPVSKGLSATISSTARLG